MAHYHFNSWLIFPKSNDINKRIRLEKSKNCRENLKNFYYTMCFFITNQIKIQYKK